MAYSDWKTDRTTVPSLFTIYKKTFNYPLKLRIEVSPLTPYTNSMSSCGQKEKKEMANLGIKCIVKI